MVFLHIGTHKTGTTSLQHFLQDQRSWLLSQGLTAYEGMVRKHKHTELHLFAQRPERDSFARYKLLKEHEMPVLEPALIDRLKKLSAEVSRGIVFSNEGLSFLRFPDEIERLARLLEVFNRPVKVIVFLRERTSFLASYTRQIYKVPGRLPTNDPTSVLYVESDTWVCDFDAMLTVYRRWFDVVVLDYDDIVGKEGTIIPAFLRELSIELEDDMLPLLDNYYHNRS